MNSNYTQANADRDFQNNNDQYQKNITCIKRGTPEEPWLRGIVHLGLANTMMRLGFYYTVIGDYAKAKGEFYNVVLIRKWLYTKYLAYHDWTPQEWDNLTKDSKVIIDPELLSSINWTTLILSPLCCEREVTLEFSRLYRTIISRNWSMYGHVNEGRYIGDLLTNILLDKQNSYTEKKRPKGLSAWKGIVECLTAIINRDADQFYNSIILAKKFWIKYATRNEKGSVYAASFAVGAGLVKIAENIFNKPLRFNSKVISWELLDDSIIPEFSHPLPDYVLT
ncbi:MAG: hypothetical protein LBT09_06780 [Planctomycetaceae bacterium]|jgi:hypothetical protein|nr:hypothetical protein [Planctomycetaceae bacterium]